MSEPELECPSAHNEFIYFLCLELFFIVKNGEVTSLLADPDLAALIGIGKTIPESPLVWCSAGREVYTVVVIT